MATQLFLRGTGTPEFLGRQGFTGFKTRQATWNGLENQRWFHSSGLSTSRGSGVQSPTTTSVTGPTAGLVGSGLHYSDPVGTAFTMSGTITFNTWISESSMNANATIRCAIFRVSSLGVLTLVIDSSFGTEAGTSAAVANWTGSPTSTDFAVGDRILVVFGWDDATAVTMGNGFTLTMNYNGATAAANGDTYVTFNENITFMSLTEPSSTTMYLTDTAVAGVGSGTSKEMWTSRGAGVTSVTRATSAGPLGSPLRLQASGTDVEWYSKRVNAFTLSRCVKARMTCLADDPFPYTNNAITWVELAVTDSDGSNAVVWSSTVVGTPNVDDTGESVDSELLTRAVWLTGANLAVTDGQRIRLRVSIAESFADTQVGNMASGFTCTFNYAGTSGGASGDAYLIFDQTITEFSATPVSLPNVLFDRRTPRRRVLHRH